MISNENETAEYELLRDYQKRADDLYAQNCNDFMKDSAEINSNTLAKEMQNAEIYWTIDFGGFSATSALDKARNYVVAMTSDDPSHTHFLMRTDHLVKRDEVFLLEDWQLADFLEEIYSINEGSLGGFNIAFGIENKEHLRDYFLVENHNKLTGKHLLMIGPDWLNGLTEPCPSLPM